MGRQLKQSKGLFSRNLRTTKIMNTENIDSSLSSGQVGGFAKAFEKQSHILDENSGPAPTFASLLRNSKFIDVRHAHLKMYLKSNRI